MFDGAVDTFRRNGLEPNYRLRDYEDFHRIAYLLGDDEIVFGNAMPNTKVIGRLHGRPLVGENTTYPVYLSIQCELFETCCQIIRRHML